MGKIMKHKIGDIVTVKNKEWYFSNCDSYGDVKLRNETFVKEMRIFLGKKVTIAKIINDKYIIKENHTFYWTDDMFEQYNLKELWD